jgi:RimJ/RimL family protein N-acetyltransferase
MIDKKTVILRKLEERDLDYALAWIKMESPYFAGENLSASPENLREMLRGQIGSPSGYDSNIYRIMETEQGESVGMVMFHSISWKNRNAFIETYFPEGAGENAFHAFTTAVDFAFEELNLHKICICLPEHRDLLSGVPDKIGAREEVVLRKHLFRNNLYHTFWVYGLLRIEYQQLKKHQPIFENRQ